MRLRLSFSKTACEYPKGFGYLLKMLWPLFAKHEDLSILLLLGSDCRLQLAVILATERRAAKLP